MSTIRTNHSRLPKNGYESQKLVLKMGYFHLAHSDYENRTTVLDEIQIERQEKSCIFDFPNGHCQNVLLMVEKSMSSYRSRDPLSMVVAPASFQTSVFSPWLFDGRRNLSPVSARYNDT